VRFRALLKFPTGWFFSVKAYSIVIAAASAIILLLIVRLGFQVREDSDHLNQDLHLLRTLAVVLGLLVVAAALVEHFRGDRDRW
jgi:hypothetical protein